MLYPKNALDFDPNLFENPTSEYRGVPFWAWNCKVTKHKIDSQIEYFRLMGMGGAMIHPRTGMDTEYMGEEYMSLVKYSADKLRDSGMFCWLYDEERFPSGCAGGMVTKNLDYRSRVLVVAKSVPEEICADKAEFDRRVNLGEKPRGYRLCAYKIGFKNKALSDYGMSKDGEYFAYVELMRESGWFNGETYSDVFNPDATDEFLRLTHEKYFETLNDLIPDTVPAIFTDEPHMKGKYNLPMYSANRATLAYNEAMNERFKQKWGKSILEIAPELIWELDNGTSVWRYRYHEFVSECFAENYGDRIGKWCETHNIAYTGHFLSERTLYSQTLALGETMRHYRAQQLPGIDILANQTELTTVKQAESVRRQMGREGLVCELYGVLEWDVSLLEHKLQGDWLAALGVTTRVHHLTFMSMGGEAKRDWPASIGYQSPWWKYYKPLEDYFARINTQLTRGKALCRVAVLHPIESFWLKFGTNEQTQDLRNLLDEQFENIAQWLLYGLVDYDYLSESLLTRMEVSASNGRLNAGGSCYQTIILPKVLTIRQTTLDALSDFSDNGGRLIVLGDAPKLVDGLPSNAPESIWNKAQRIDCDKFTLLDALKSERDIDVRDVSSGKRADNLVYNLRQDGDELILFIAHVNDEDSSKRRDYEIQAKGEWDAAYLDTDNGEIKSAYGYNEDGITRIMWQPYANDSILLRLKKGKIAPPEAKTPAKSEFMKLTKIDEFKLCEPNALLLDRAMYALDDDELSEECDILKLDNALRDKAGLPQRDGDIVQPWLIKQEKALHSARLVYSFKSDLAYEGALLAMEQPENAEISLNGEAVSNVPAGWYVDEDIQTIPLPQLKIGVNTIEIRVPLTQRTNLESIYILGDFGTAAVGTQVKIIKKPESIELDDLTKQGLTFYTGNAEYTFKFSLKEDCTGAALRLKHIVSPAVSAKLDGRDMGVIYTRPWQIELGDLSAGEHTIELTVCGNRFNGFGTLHNANPNYKWYGPNAYRTEGDDRTDNYLTRPWGLMGEAELLK